MSKHTKLSTLLAILLCVGSTSTTAIAKPKLKFTQGYEFDWGNVAPGKVETSIIIKNEGDEELNISHVKVSCGCTSAPLTKMSLAPGDTASMHVTIDFTDKMGEQRKEIYVTSNDAQDSIQTILLKANVVKAFVCQPMMFPSLMRLPVDQPAVTSVAITNASSETITVAEPRFEGEGMRVKLELENGLTFKPGETKMLTAHITPTLFGMLRGKVLLTSSSKFAKEVWIDLICGVTNPDGQAVKQ